MRQYRCWRRTLETVYVNWQVFIEKAPVKWIATNILKCHLLCQQHFCGLIWSISAFVSYCSFRFYKSYSLVHQNFVGTNFDKISDFLLRFPRISSSQTLCSSSVNLHRFSLDKVDLNRSFATCIVKEGINSSISSVNLIST